jgi:hypothetical protein
MYSNGKISNMITSRGTKYVSFEYKENYVKAIRDSETEYFLNSSKLPVRIVYNGVNNRDVIFYYKSGTNILDSVINKLVPMGITKEKYTFVYNGENIEKVVIQSHYSNTTAVSESYISYTYSSVPNIFRKSEPLLFIYNNPVGTFDYHSLLLYFPKTFSASTFSSFSHPDYGGRIKSGKLTYSLNRDGKILKESYEGAAHRHDYSYNR